MDGSPSSLRAVFVLTVMMSLSLLFSVTTSGGQTTSITSSGLNTTITPNPAAPVPTYTITGGTRNGTNLFHSFGEFSIGTAERAVFANDPVTRPDTTNILSRVTDGHLSRIYGSIETQFFGNAALWLINPAGIVFGPSASLNVGGSAHFSTADYLRLGSGNDRFYADLGKTSQLTSAAVTAFGFLNSHPAAIAVKGSNLAVPNGQALSLVGGNRTFPDPDNPSVNVPSGITIAEVTINGVTRSATLSAPSGQINVASVTSSAEVLLNPVGQSPGLDVVAAGQTRTGQQPTMAEGTVMIRGGALVGTVTLGNNTVLKADAVSGGKAGNIDIEANTLNTSPGTLISAAMSESASDGNVVIAATNQITISAAGVVTGPTASGNTANVTITTPGMVSLTDGTTISTNSSEGNAGSVFIRGGQLAMVNAGIEARTTTGTTTLAAEEDAKGGLGCCKGGAIDIVADTINLEGTLKAGSGKNISTNNQGDIVFRTNNLTVDNFSIFSDGQRVSNYPRGNRTGHISIGGLKGIDSFANEVIFRNQASVNTAGFFFDNGCGGTACGLQGGDISVKSTNIGLSHSQFLTEQGSISLHALQSIRSGGGNTVRSDSGFTLNISNNKGITLQAGESIFLTNGDNVSAVSSASIHSAHFKPPPILITAPEIALQATTVGANVQSLASGGDISFGGRNIVFSDGATISSNTLGSDPLNGGGNAGDISIFGIPKGANAESLRVLNGSTISTQGPPSNAFGSAGTITLNANSIMFDAGHATVSHAGIGGGGRIDISGGDLLFTNKSSIEAITTGRDMMGPSPQGGQTLYPAAQGGDIAIQGANIALAAHSTINASSTGDGNAGAINLSSADSISIANSTVSTSAVAASGGNITLTAPNMVHLVGANLTSSVAGPPGSNGGNITIDTVQPQFVIMQGNSRILAKANEGQGGRITIIGAVVLQEPGSVLDATAGPAGISGSINIQAPFQQLSGAIAPLPQAFAVATNLYGQRCATEKGGQFSSFVQGARDGVPPQPGDLIPSPLLLELDEAASNISSQSASSLSAIRLGLPEFEQSSRSSLTAFVGCRS